MRKQGKQNTNSTDFTTVWKVKAGEDIEFFAKGVFSINWGDGCIEEIEADNMGWLKHKCLNSGTCTVVISAGITGFMVNEDTARQLLEIKQWGQAQWDEIMWMFWGAENMVYTATDTPDTSKVENMCYVFANCLKFNGPIAHWDFNNVKSIEGMLECTPAFDQDLRQLQVTPAVNTKVLFGWGDTLAQYNEKYDAQEQQQKFMDVLTP